MLTKNIDEKIEKYLVNEIALSPFTLLGKKDKGVKNSAYLISKIKKHTSKGGWSEGIVTIYYDEGVKSWKCYWREEDYKDFIGGIKEVGNHIKSGKKIYFDRIDIYPKGKEIKELDVYIEAKKGNSTVWSFQQNNEDDYYPSVDFG